MDPLLAIKAALTESLGADAATPVVESLQKYKDTLEAGVKDQITEGVKEAKVKLEADYLQKLEESKTKADEQIKSELGKYEKLLAERTKAILERAIDSHGDRLAKIQEDMSTKRGSVLLQEVEALVVKAKAEITEQTKTIKPEDHQKLQDEVKALKESLETAKKAALEAKARANVAEQESKELKESLEGSLKVIVEETEPTKTIPAAEEHHDSTGKDPNAAITEGVKEGDTKFTPTMLHMRRLAGISK